MGTRAAAAQTPMAAIARQAPSGTRVAAPTSAPRSFHSAMSANPTSEATITTKGIAAAHALASAQRAIAEANGFKAKETGSAADERGRNVPARDEQRRDARQREEDGQPLR
jgi:hypothetical protein